MTLDEYLKNTSSKLKARTTCFLIDGDRILLGKKLEGIGKGFYVGIGGKQKKSESLEETLKRELDEETSVIPVKFEQVATLNFYFIENSKWNQKVYVYLCEKWKGDPVETSEIKPVWFNITKIPFDEMWEDALYYLPYVLRRKVVIGDFLYDGENRVVDSKLDVRLKISSTGG
ncbi:8-oxo-dGTP diphosphatase [Patescibacteria group bacterium]